MIEVAEARKSSYLADFARFEKKFERKKLSRLHALRRDAIAHFGALGFPTTRHEEWKYTNVAPIAATPFTLAEARRVEPQHLERRIFDDRDCMRLVFVNGRFDRGLSTAEELTGGARAGSLADALQGDGELPGLVDRHLAHYADSQSSAFTALNTAFLEDGAFIHLPKHAVLDRPLHLVFFSAASAGPSVSHPRVLILAGEASRLTVVETYVGDAGAPYFTNAVTEVVAGENSRIEHYKLQQEAEAGFHIARIRVEQERNSSFTSHSFSVGSTLARTDLEVVLAGEGSECSLYGLYAVSGRQHVDNHTSIDHVKPHCDSRELYKGILAGSATGVFNGKIVVRRDAQKTNAKQTNKNLLLSEDALVNTKPQLEISADDVKCTHGATIGQLDDDALFYLRARGIHQQAAQDMLTHAFAVELVDNVGLEPVRKYLEQALLSQVRGGERVREGL